MKNWKDLFVMLRKNWLAFAIFELLYKTLSFTIFIPLLHGVLNGIMQITGYHYLTKENILLFLKNPITVVSLLLLLLLMTFYSMIDISAVILLLDQSYHKQKADLFATFLTSIQNAAKVLRKENFFAIVVILFLLPFLNLGVASGYLTTISIPSFLLDYIRSHRILTVLLVLCCVILELLMLRSLYTFHYFTLENCSFRQACKKSAALGSTSRKWDLAVLLAIQLICYLVYRFFWHIGLSLFSVINRLFSWLELAHIVSVSIAWMLVLTVLATAIAFGTPISYACISLLFYRHKDKMQEACIPVRDRLQMPSPRTRRLLSRGKFFLIAASILCIGLYSYGRASGRIKLQVESLKTMEVTAHRGASKQYPENTMAAFEGAVALGADWIELDIQQSKDGQLFVMHDRSLRRTTGVTKYSWELTWDEISKLDAGSYFSSEFAGEKIPLLSDVITFAKENDIRLNIELKPSSFDVDLEQHLVDLIHQEDFAQRCVVTSQKYDVLETIKSIDPDIKTVYVMSLAYGNINRLTAADSFSVEVSNVSQRMVSRVHNAGKELYVWTVNSRTKIRRMIELNVDNIITDDVSLALDCIYTDSSGAAILP